MTTSSLKHQSATTALIDACRMFCTIEEPTDEQYIAFADQCAHIHSPEHKTIREYVEDAWTKYQETPVITTYGNLKLTFGMSMGIFNIVSMSLYYRVFSVVDPNMHLYLVKVRFAEFGPSPWRVTAAVNRHLSHEKFDAQILGKPLVEICHFTSSPICDARDACAPASDEF